MPSADNETYRIEPYSPERIDDLIYLFRDAFGESCQRNDVQRKFDTAFFGHPVIGYIAYTSSGEPAAYYGVFPSQLEYRGTTFLAAQSGDTMTHSRHRGKGLFVQLARMTYERCAREGIHCVYGFPNRNSYPGFMKHLGWKDIGRMHVFVFSFSALPFYRISIGSLGGLFSPLYRFWLGILYYVYRSTHPLFEHSTQNQDTVFLHRDMNLLTYKRSTSNHIIQLAKTRVWVSGKGGQLEIGDIEKIPENRFHSVLSSLRSFCFLAGYSSARLEVSPGTWLDRALSQFQTPQDGTAIGYLDLSGTLPLANLRFVMADYDTF